LKIFVEFFNSEEEASEEFNVKGKHEFDSTASATLASATLASATLASATIRASAYGLGHNPSVLRFSN
jgi:hypothetical protein